ncbi:hypothetical protein [Sulfurimonas sp.]
MYKKIILALLVVISLVFSGCGDSDTTCRIDVQKALDKGNYDKVISDLNGVCSGAYTTSDLNMNLAAAYMGKSGYSVSDVADMLINSDNNGGDSFTSFLSSVDAKKTADSLPLLSTANEYFLKAIANGSIDKSTVLCSLSRINNSNDSRVTNACLYIGFNLTIQASNTITYLTGNIDTLISSINDDTNTTPYDMRASLDALAWSMGLNDPTITDPAITDKEITIDGNPFTHIKVDYTNHGTFYRLAKSTNNDNNTTVITDGYCDSDGNKTACAGIENSDGSIDINNPLSSSCYACPVLLDKNATLGVAQLLVDTLNNGADTIAAVSNDPDISNSIDDFKEEITGSRDGTVTIDDIIKYLQK